MITLQKIDFPADCVVISHEFYDYDPASAYNVADSIQYLSEDMLQCRFPKEEVLIDLGWYGDPTTNKGEYRIHVIKHENWEVPFNVIYSKSTPEALELLGNILLYFKKVDLDD